MNPSQENPMAGRKQELEALNPELLELLTTLRDSIDAKLEELGVEDSDFPDSED
jgi:hypothetical protein